MLRYHTSSPGAPGKGSTGDQRTPVSSQCSHTIDKGIPRGLPSKIDKQRISEHAPAQSRGNPSGSRKGKGRTEVRKEPDYSYTPSPITPGEGSTSD